MNYTLRSELIRDNAIEHIKSLPIGEPYWRIVINEYRGTKSQEQLGYLWGGILPTICKHVEETKGEHYTPEDVYGWMVDEYAETMVVTLGCKTKVIKRSLSKMNFKQASEFIERIIQHCAVNMDLVIPEAE